MGTRPDPDRLAVWREFLETHSRVLSQLEQELQARHDLDLTWYDVLVQLSEAPEQRLRMLELADAVLLSKSGLSRLVDRMEEAGFVARETCPEDRRGTLACLTPEGRKALRRCAPVHLAGIHEHFTSHLTDAEVEALHSAFSKIREAMTDA